MVDHAPPPPIPLTPKQVWDEVDTILCLPGPVDDPTIIVVRLNPVDWINVYRRTNGDISGFALDTVLQAELAYFRINNGCISLIIVADYHTRPGTIDTREIEDMRDVDEYTLRTTETIEEEGYEEEDDDGEGPFDGTYPGGEPGDFTTPASGGMDGRKRSPFGIPPVVPGLGGLQPEPGEPDVLPGPGEEGRAMPPGTRRDDPRTDDDEDGVACGS